jgi:glycosyltransferase involved in cell wall biosynthesis
MRVLQLISSAGYYGAEAVVVSLSKALERAGCQVIVAAFENAHCPNREFAGRAVAAGLETVLVPCAGRLDNRAVDKVRDLIRSQRIAVLHTHGYKANAYGSRAARLEGVAALATCHNWVGGSLPVRMYDVLDHLVLRRFHRIAAVSETVRRSLRRYGIAEDRISVIPNGVDIDAFRASGSAFANEIGKKERTVIGLVGRLVWDKGGDWFLRAAERLAQIKPETLFVFVGDGPAHRELKALATDAGLGDRVIFAGSRTDMPDVYAALDVVVLPSRKEAMPMSVIEAMAAGRPVIATKVGAVGELVIDGETGLLVERNDFEGFSAALFSLVQDLAAAARMGERGRRRAEQFSAETMANRYVAAYASLRARQVVC